MQKRLLVRFKDKNAAPLQNLDLLLRETYNQLIDLANSYTSSELQYKESSNRLACGTQLLLLLVQLRCSLDEANYSVLVSHLSPIIDNTQDQGWEEYTSVGLDHLLRTALTITASDAAIIPTLKALDDTSKLKKQIAVVCDRLLKGAKLHKSGAVKKRSTSSSSLPTKK